MLLFTFTVHMINKQTKFYEKNGRFVVSKFVTLSDELINYVSEWSGDDYYHFRNSIELLSWQ